MGKDVHDIDDLFRNEIGKYREDPQKELWDAIEAKLDKEDAVAYKKKFNTLKKLTIVLSLILLCFVLYEKVGIGKNNHSVSGENPGKSTNEGRSTVTKDFTPVHALSANGIPAPPNIASEKEAGYNAGPPDSIQYAAEFKKREYNDQIKSMAPGDRVVQLKKTSAKHYSPENKHQPFYVGGNNALRNRQRAIHERNAISLMGAGHYTALESSGQILGSVADYPDPAKDVLYARSPVDLAVVDNSFPEFRNTPLYKKLLLKDLKQRVVPMDTLVNALKKLLFKPRWELTMLFSPELAKSDLDDDSDDRNGAPDDEKMEIENREKHKFSYSAGVLLSYQFNRHWAIQSGLLYSNTHITIEPQNIYAAQDNGGIAYKYNSACGYAYVKTSLSAPQVIGDSIMANNAQQHISYLSIPVLLKYKFTKNKWSVSPGMGITANILTRAAMQTALENGISSEPVMVSKLKGTRALFLGLVFNTEIQYHFLEKWSLNMMPSFNYSITAITKNNVVETYPYSFGIGVGITYTFNRLF